MNHRVRDSALTASAGLQPIQQTHPLTVTEPTPLSVTEHIERSSEGIHRLRNRTHVRIITAPADRNTSMPTSCG
jgi:hypothetical protein